LALAAAAVAPVYVLVSTSLLPLPPPLRRRPLRPLCNNTGYDYDDSGCGGDEATTWFF